MDNVGRYMNCSEVLCCTITAHLRDFEVKFISMDSIRSEGEQDLVFHSEFRV